MTLFVRDFTRSLIHHLSPIIHHPEDQTSKAEAEEDERRSVSGPQQGS